MKIESKLFGLLAAFFGVMAVIYGLWGGWREPVGVVALLLSMLLAGMVAYYTHYIGSKLPLRPEDDEEGDIGQIEGEFGFFSPYSWWPLWLGLTAAVCFLGLAVGWWLFIIGASFGVFAVVGWTFEYFKGEHAL